jgi:hypothetical protein
MAYFDFDQLQSLKAELVRLHDPGIAVPSELDDTILSRARQSFRVRVQRWVIVRRVSVGLAAAAILTVGIRVFIPHGDSPRRPLQRPQLAQIADINHDGRVDILDAYSVARRIARHEPLNSAWDVNGDGVVDQKDVDIIANLAVHVSGETRQ